MSGSMTDSISPRDFQWLRQATAAWGGDLLRVQGPGGNVSIKSGNLLRVKASGSRMDGALHDAAWADVDIRTFLAAWDPGTDSNPDLAGDETAYTLAIGRAALPGPRPSMETGFHAALPWKWIVHLHSLAGILIGELPRSDDRTRRAFEPVLQAGFQVVTIPPSVPGAALTRAVTGAAASLSGQACKGILILARCHGTIWAANDAELLAATEQAFETAARSTLGMDRFPMPRIAVSPGESTCLDFGAWPDFAWQDEPAFPDMAVFHPDGASWPRANGRTVTMAPGPRALDRAEIVSAQALLATAGAGIGTRICLPAGVARRTIGLELEKLRLGPRQGGPQ